MNIELNNINHITSTGIYKIYNRANKKYYIGSTQDSFMKRWKHHIDLLRNGTHKNSHLQRAFNKYGEDKFIFSILETCEPEDCLRREQIYLDNMEKGFSYNINPLATGPSKNPETIAKQTASRKLFYAECLPYYQKLKNNEIAFEEIPMKFHQKIKSLLNHTPWNKGLKYKSTDHLKVSHKKSDRTNCKNTMREKEPIIYIYDINWNFVDRFRSAKDLEELSLTMIFPLILRNRRSKKGMPREWLCSANIKKCAQLKKPYKGLYFTFEPLHPGIDDVNEPKSVKVWNDNTEVNSEINKSESPYSIETETQN